MSIPPTPSTKVPAGIHPASEAHAGTKADATDVVGGTRTEAGSSYGDFTPNRGSTVYVDAAQTSAAPAPGGDAGSAGLAGTSADQSRAGRQKEAGNPEADPD